MKGDKEAPGNYTGITLLNVVGKVFCKILNNRLVEHWTGKEHCMKVRRALVMMLCIIIVIGGG